MAVVIFLVVGLSHLIHGPDEIFDTMQARGQMIYTPFIIKNVLMMAIYDSFAAMVAHYDGVRYEVSSYPQNGPFPMCKHDSIASI